MAPFMKLVQIPPYVYIPLTIVKTGQSVCPHSVQGDGTNKGAGDTQNLAFCGRGEHGFFGHLEEALAGGAVFEAGGEAPRFDEHFHDSEGVVQDEVVG